MSSYFGALKRLWQLLVGQRLVDVGSLLNKSQSTILNLGMKFLTIRRLTTYFLWAVTVLVVIVVLFPTWVALGDKITLLYALHNARSVRVEHYQMEFRDLGGQQETILGSKDLSPEDFHKISDALPLVLGVEDPGVWKKCIFDPHHRIIITDGKGNETILRVCFICDQYQVNNGIIQDTPSAWMQTLRHFFSEEGLPESPNDR